MLTGDMVSDVDIRTLLRSSHLCHHHHACRRTQLIHFAIAQQLSLSLFCSGQYISSGILSAVAMDMQDSSSDDMPVLTPFSGQFQVRQDEGSCRGGQSSSVQHSRVPAPPQVSRKRKRVSCVEGSKETGPTILVAFVAHPVGRWSALRCGQRLQDSWQELLQGQLHRARDLFSGRDVQDLFTLDAGQGSASLIVGLGVMTSWERASSPPECAVEDQMRALLLNHHRRSSSTHLLRHSVLRSVVLQQPLDVSSESVMQKGSVLSGPVLSAVRQRMAWECCWREPVGRQLGELRPVSAFLTSLQFKASVMSKIYFWPVTLPVALCLASGVFTCDVTAVVPRRTAADWEIPVSLPRGALRKMKKLPSRIGVERAAPSIPLGQSESGAPQAWTGAVKHALHPYDWMLAVGLGRDLKQQGFARRTVIASLKFMYPKSWRQKLQDRKDRLKHMPSRVPLILARKRLDVASMLSHRAWYQQNGPCFRFVSHDASPQHNMSWEAFLSAERVIRRSAVRGKELSQVNPSDFRSRIMPVSTLGHGFCDLPNKVDSVVHQTFLEYGPAEDSVRSACDDVRQILSDMGVEFAIADCKDVIGQCLGELGCFRPAVRTFMFPYALQTPGLLHIVDWIIRDAIQSFPWWPKWQNDCKKILQHVHGTKVRDRLASFVDRSSAPAGDIAAAKASLRTATTRFAKWRWKTLHGAAKDMLRIEQAIRLALAADSGALLSRDHGSIAAISLAMASGFTWDAARAVHYTISELMKFSSWVQACDCHEAEILQGKKISCPFKGCRARSVSARVHSLLRDLDSARTRLPLGQFGSIDVKTVGSVLTRIMASIDLKLSWVHELPYLIWQACIFT